MKKKSIISILGIIIFSVVVFGIGFYVHDLYILNKICFYDYDLKDFNSVDKTLDSYIEPFFLKNVKGESYLKIAGFFIVNHEYILLKKTRKTYVLIFQTEEYGNIWKKSCQSIIQIILNKKNFQVFSCL